MTMIKICGITNLDDATAAVEAGADALGFNFYVKSPRYIEPELAREIVAKLPDKVMRIGVFVDALEEVVRHVSQLVRLDYLQFHGDETPYYCAQFASPYWKAFRLRDERTLALMEKYEAYAYLIDTYRAGQFGGTGRVTDWDLAARAAKKWRVILAGGLTPENVAEALAEVKPWGLDVCSGIEKEPGLKDHHRLTQFIARARLTPHLKSLSDEF